MLFLKELWSQRKKRWISIVTNFLAIFLLLIVNLISNSISSYIEEELNKMGANINVIYTSFDGWQDSFEKRIDISEKSEIYQGYYGDINLLLVDESFFALFKVDYYIDEYSIIVSDSLEDYFCYESVGGIININGTDFILKGYLEGVDNLYLDFSNMIIISKQYAYCFQNLNKIYFFESNQYVNDTLDELIGKDNYTLVNQKDNMKSIMKLFDFVMDCFEVILLCCLGVSFVGLINHTVQNVELRKHEIGIKKSLGATRKDIYFQFMLESIIVVIISLILSLIVIFMIGHWIEFDYNLSFYRLVFIVLIFALFVGLFPAIKASKVSVIECIKKGID